MFSDAIGGVGYLNEAQNIYCSAGRILNGDICLQPQQDGLRLEELWDIASNVSIG